jgi:hypothetical protein
LPGSGAAPDGYTDHAADSCGHLSALLPPTLLNPEFIVER